MLDNTIEIEQVVLGTILSDKNALHKVQGILNVDVFQSSQHQGIYSVILRIHNDRRPIDILTVNNELKGQKIDIPNIPLYLTDLTDRIVSSSNIEEHALILREKYITRHAILKAKDFIGKLEAHKDPLEEIDTLINELSTNINLDTQQFPILFSDAFAERVKEYETPLPNGLLGNTSGFRNLDDAINGFQPGCLYIVAARPSMGKTAFALNLARNQAIFENKPGVIFNLEMSQQQIVDRLVSAETNIPLNRIEKRIFRDNEHQRILTINNLINSKLRIDDKQSTLNEIRSKSIRLKHQFDIGFIVVDYLQLIHLGQKTNNREQEVAAISRGLKNLAKELKVPVIALSQLNREVDRTKDNRPKLSDLRESGAIEQDADVVMFLYRPEYYGMTQDSNGNSIVGLSEIILAKNRQGITGTQVLRFNGSVMRFDQYEPATSPELKAGF